MDSALIVVCSLPIVAAIVVSIPIAAYHITAWALSRALDR